jgi:EpsD family peptidyl-prolyl cis-trans isomerase
MPKLTSVSLIALASIALTLSGCKKTAEGQVVAVVNGEEITQNELNGEISELNLPSNSDKTQVRAQVLQRMVERRLLAQAAKDAGLDRDPNYVSQERRMKERLLVSMYGRKAMDTINVPDTAKVDAFIASHPQMFASRTRYTLEQLQFEMPADVSRIKELDSAHTLPDVIARLTSMGISFQRGSGALDSATVSPDALKRILSLPQGEPFIVPNGNSAIVSVITKQEPIIISPEQARPMAVQAMRSEELNKIGQQRLDEAKSKAKIEYQPGYEPPADQKKASTVVGDSAKSTDALAAPEAK